MIWIYFVLASTIILIAQFHRRPHVRILFRGIICILCLIMIILNIVLFDLIGIFIMSICTIIWKLDLDHLTAKHNITFRESFKILFKRGL